jgi:light-regulated signal transduction histidine kinase (bacteriophytochrome)
VEVGAIPGGDVHTFFVRDNGAGLYLAKAAKLFEPFQRFHSVVDFPGPGVGLAIVKRTVKRHGDRIWAESHLTPAPLFLYLAGESSQRAGAGVTEALR